MEGPCRTGENSGFVFAYYVTGHGFGHATRVVEVVRQLVLAGHEVHVVTAAPEFVFKSVIPSPKLHIRKVLLDSGAVQSDALTVDRFASLEKYRKTAVIPRAAIIADEVEWLQSIKAHLVVSDIVPVACRAAKEAGIPSVCVTNFSWDFIYAEYVMAAGHQYRSIVWQIAEDYSHARFLIRLPGYCPMPAFRDVVDVPLVVRKAQTTREEVRKVLGITEEERLLLFNFGGQDAGWFLKEEFLPAGWKCLVCGAPAGQVLPRNFRTVQSDAYTPDLIAASDCMLGKIGYGTTSEALTFKVPFVFVRRDYFNEEPFLRNMLEYHQCGVEMIRRDFLMGRWSPYLEKALIIKPVYNEPLNGGEMPIREACHVAVQLSRPGKQRLWKHAMARNWHDPRPIVQIVSFGSELCNRAPTFDMDLSDFLSPEGKPVSYDKARAFFEKDPSQKWAAYIAGTILVLMREKGIQFQEGISILVSSAVPEGKGVSSSAALEVATMSAIIAAYGLNISAREIAVLCQKVENLIVGAPCGVMDQMASACGEAYKLLAMVCQPAEVKEHIDIPSHLRFWGIDSGIRHSVGGTDYGSVRVGAFMGRKIITSMAFKMGSELAQNLNTSPEFQFEEFNSRLFFKEAHEQHLCNFSSQRFEAVYASALPDQMRGEDFLKVYGNHNDEVTKIVPSRLYPVKAAASHAVYENFRTQAFAVILTSTSSDDQLKALGELMYQAHISYSRCGLGSTGTDRLVQLVQQAEHFAMPGETSFLFGAKITGGGCGGTVCILGQNNEQTAEQVYKVRQQYKTATGHLPFVFEGSSPGAGRFGYLRIKHCV